MIWADDSFTYRKKVTISGAQISGSLTNFPILLHTTDTDLTNCRADGYDIKFYDSGGTSILSWERQSFNNVDGHLIAWINIPKISSNESHSGNTIWMYYGDADASDNSNTTGTWNSDYFLVLHMNQDSAPILDSTVNNNNSIVEGGTPLYEQSGKVGYCIRIPSSSGFGFSTAFPKLSDDGNQITIESWIKRNVTGVTNVIASRYDGYDSKSAEWYLRFVNTDDTLNWAIREDPGPGGLTNNYNTTTTFTDITNFHYFALRHEAGDGSLTKIFVDGSEDITCSWTTPASQDMLTEDVSYSGAIGTLYYTAAAPVFRQSISGLQDETRISTTLRSPEWLWTSYSTVYNSGSFLRFGTEELNTPIPTGPSDCDNPGRIALNTTNYGSELYVQTTNYGNELRQYNTCS